MGHEELENGKRVFVVGDFMGCEKGNVGRKKKRDERGK